MERSTSWIHFAYQFWIPSWEHIIAIDLLYCLTSCGIVCTSILLYFFFTIFIFWKENYLFLIVIDMYNIKLRLKKWL